MAYWSRMLSVAAVVAAVSVAPSQGASTHYSLAATANTPSIELDLTTGVLDIKGRSTGVNGWDFYKPLVDNLSHYITVAPLTTTVNIRLDAIDASSKAGLLDVLKKLEATKGQGSAVTINWYYETSDEDMLETGEDYQAEIMVPINLIAVTN